MHVCGACGVWCVYTVRGQGGKLIIRSALDLCKVSHSPLISLFRLLSLLQAFKTLHAQCIFPPVGCVCVRRRCTWSLFYPGNSVRRLL